MKHFVSKMGSALLLFAASSVGHAQAPVVLCPIVSLQPTLAACQANDLRNCSNAVREACGSLVRNAFSQQYDARDVDLHASPTAWNDDVTEAVSETPNTPPAGPPDYTNYRSIRRWTQEMYAAAGVNAALVDVLRNRWEANQNVVDSCEEYAYERSYSQSRALDAFARQGNTPEAIYRLAYERGGIAATSLAAGQRSLTVTSRSGQSRPAAGSLGSPQRNGFAELVRIAPVLLMFVDNAAGGIPALTDAQWRKIAAAQLPLATQDFAWHRDMPGVMSRLTRVTPAVLDDGTLMRAGYVDQELNEAFASQERIQGLLAEFVSKSQRFMTTDERSVPVYGWDLRSRQSTRSSASLPLVVFPSAGGSAGYFLYEQNSVAAAKDAQRASFNAFIASRDPAAVELRSLLKDIVNALKAAPAGCLANTVDYNQCDWSKAFFANRLLGALEQGAYVNVTRPRYPDVGTFSTRQIDLPIGVAEEYEQCTRVLPVSTSFVGLRNPRQQWASVVVPRFCAAGGAGLDANGQPAVGFRTNRECSTRGGTWYETPQFDTYGARSDYTTNSERARQGIIELDYYQRAKVAYEAERIRARLLLSDRSMVDANGRFRMPDVARGQSGVLGNRDYVAIDYDYGYRWNVTGSGASSLCEMHSGFAARSRASVYLAGRRANIADTSVSLNSDVASAHADLLGVAVFAPIERAFDSTRRSPFNITASGRESIDISYGQLFMVGPVPLTVRGGIAGTVSFAAGLNLEQRGAANARDCNANGMAFVLSGTASPRVSIEAFMSVAVGGSFLGIGAEAGVRGELTLIDASLDAQINTRLGLPAGSQDINQAGLTVGNRYGYGLQTMSGRLSAYVRVEYLVGSKTWKKQIVGWDGYRYGDTATTTLADVKLVDLRRAAGGI